MTSEKAGTSTTLPVGRLAVLFGSVVLIGLTLTWTFLSMRAVMDVGGSCADGGPYVIAQPCPEGAGFIGIAIPIMVLATLAATFAAAGLAAPGLILPMWTILFGSLGWNFLEYGIREPGGAAGWIVCGIVFELMAIPGLIGVLGARRLSVMTSTDTSSLSGPAAWWGIYAALGTLGLLLGAWSFGAWA